MAGFSIGYPENEARSFTGETVLISGGSRGIGLATARAFLDAGARVAICARDKERLERVGAELFHRGELLTAAVDLRDSGAVTDFVTRARDQLGEISILVNNAGVLHPGPFAERSFRSMDEEIDINLKGLLYLTGSVLPYMTARRRGTIVNISSGAALRAIPGFATYSATKFAVNGFTQALADEVGGEGVRVYGICPGRVATEMQLAFSGEIGGMPPERIAEQVLRLAGNHPPIAPGECLPVMG